jgi:hypothetical protein
VTVVTLSLIWLGGAGARRRGTHQAFRSASLPLGENSNFIRSVMDPIGSSNLLSSGTTWGTMKSISVGR